jgi:hypothetical protein
MTITTTKLTRAAGLAAIVAGVLTSSSSSSIPTKNRPTSARPVGW